MRRMSCGMPSPDACGPARRGWAAVLKTVLLAAALAGCATRSADVAPRPADPEAYAGWGCERLRGEIDQVQARAADVAYAVDARVGNNMIALGVGVIVFWPALLAMRPDGDEAVELATLKGRYEALRVVSERQGCATGPGRPAADVAAGAWPLAVGERLVYEQRIGGREGVQRLAMRLLSVPPRGGMEFALELDGQALPGTWRQDAYGNPELEGRAPQIGWRRLLRPQLQLGQVLAGELAAAGEAHPAARVRGQVVALGPQVMNGRSFDVAVIELFGDAPQVGPTRETAGTSTRIDGVMAVDRRSGLLLRLELRSSNPEFALTRRLLRVETAEPRAP